MAYKPGYYDPHVMRWIGFISLIPLLLIVACEGIRFRDREALRPRFPPQVQASSFISFDICSRFFGGYSYVVRISPQAVSNLRQAGQLKSMRPADLQKETSIWMSAEDRKWSYDGGPPGLSCLRHMEVDGQRIDQHIFRKGSFYRSEHPRQGDYIVPSLGVMVGGFDPR